MGNVDNFFINLTIRKNSCNEYIVYNFDKIIYYNIRVNYSVNIYYIILKYCISI